jgi:hypothetical protein
VKRTLTDKEKAAQLRHCAVVYVSHLRDSTGSKAAGPHWCVILDADEQIAESLGSEPKVFQVVGISNDEVISAPEFRMSVPSKFGLSGFIQCEWTPWAHFDCIDKIKLGEVDGPDRQTMFKLIRDARAARKKKSTQS